MDSGCKVGVGALKDVEWGTECLRILVAVQYSEKIGKLWNARTCSKIDRFWNFKLRWNASKMYFNITKIYTYKPEN